MTVRSAYIVGRHRVLMRVIPDSWHWDVLAVPGVSEIPDPKRAFTPDRNSVEVHMTLQAAERVRGMFGGRLSVHLLEDES